MKKKTNKFLYIHTFKNVPYNIRKIYEENRMLYKCHKSKIIRINFYFANPTEINRDSIKEDFLQTKNKPNFKIPTVIVSKNNAQIKESFRFFYKSLIDTYRKRLCDGDDDDECSSIIYEKRN
jgi:hypothetical protein